MRNRVNVFYSGRVQGVGFRYTVRELACGYEVTGYVQNLADGRVELLAEGDEEELKGFLEGIGQSQLGSLVRNASVHWSPGTGQYNRFQIQY